jgi:hypothetical protein
VSVSAYRLADEPRPGTLAKLAVRPLWPLFAVMFAGPWLSWPWFVLNAFAVGSPTRGRELRLAVGGAIGSLVLVVGLALLVRQVAGLAAWLSYLLTLVVIWQLGITYALYTLQARTFGIYEYYGGIVQNGLPVVFVGFILDGRLGPALSAGLGRSGALLRMALGF